MMNEDHAELSSRLSNGFSEVVDADFDSLPSNVNVKVLLRRSVYPGLSSHRAETWRRPFFDQREHMLVRLENVPSPFPDGISR